MYLCKQAGLAEHVFAERSGGIGVELLKLQAYEKTVAGDIRDDFGTVSERIRK